MKMCDVRESFIGVNRQSKNKQGAAGVKLIDGRVQHWHRAYIKIIIFTQNINYGRFYLRSVGLSVVVYKVHHHSHRFILWPSRSAVKLGCPNTSPSDNLSTGSLNTPLKPRRDTKS